MEPKHRDVLRKNRTFLIENFDELDAVCDKLFEKDTLTNGMVQEIKAGKTPNDRTRALLDKLPKRGPKAFDNFCQALVETSQDFVARKLNPDLKQSGVTCVQPESESSVKSKSDEMNVGLPTKNVDKKSMPVPVQVPMKGTKPVNTVSPVVSSPSPTKPSNFSAGTQPQSSSVSVRSEPNQPKNDTGTTKLPPLFDDDKINQKIKPKEDWPGKLNMSLGSSDFKVQKADVEDLEAQADGDVYPMSKDLKKQALIICNRDYENDDYKERKLADMDSYRLCSVLQDFGFNVDTGTNLTHEELIQKLEKEKTLDGTSSKLAVFMLVILSYGGKGTVKCIDDKEVHVQDIVEMFSAKKCPLMAGVPKIFLIQACGVKMKDNRPGGDATESKGHQEKQMQEILSSMSDLQLEVPALSGDAMDTQASMHTSSSEQSLSEPLTLENNNDILVAMATTADLNPSKQEYSSMFILGLCSLLCLHAKSEHFVNLLKGVNRLKLSDDPTEPMKLCEFKHSLTKRLFLMPGCQK